MGHRHQTLYFYTQPSYIIHCNAFLMKQRKVKYILISELDSQVIRRIINLLMHQEKGTALPSVNLWASMNSLWELFLVRIFQQCSSWCRGAKNHCPLIDLQCHSPLFIEIRDIHKDKLIKIEHKLLQYYYAVYD